MPGADGHDEPGPVTLPDDVDLPADAKAGDIIPVGFRVLDPKKRTGEIVSDQEEDEGMEPDGDEMASDDGDNSPRSMDELFSQYRPGRGED